MYIARDETRMVAMADALSLFIPRENILLFPAWDCLPYDRVSPNNKVISRRLRTLIDLTKNYESKLNRTVLLTTCNAAFQRIPKRLSLDPEHISIEVSVELDVKALTGYLKRNGYTRSGTVMEPSEYAIRGGIIDLYPFASINPYRTTGPVESLNEFYGFHVQKEKIQIEQIMNIMN